MPDGISLVLFRRLRTLAFGLNQAGVVFHSEVDSVGIRSHRTNLQKIQRDGNDSTLDWVFPQQEGILSFDFCVRVIWSFLVVVLVVIVVSPWNIRGFRFPMEQLLKRKASQPWVTLDFLWPIGAQPASWLPLNQLIAPQPFGLPATNWWTVLTRLMKSQASMDQPLGISFSLIATCFDSIWSLISFLDLPK